MAGVGLSGMAIVLSLLFLISEGREMGKALKEEDGQGSRLEKVLSVIKQSSP